VEQKVAFFESINEVQLPFLKSSSAIGDNSNDVHFLNQYILSIQLFMCIFCAYRLYSPGARFTSELSPT
jgi:hypothetical protein